MNNIEKKETHPETDADIEKELSKFCEVLNNIKEPVRTRSIVKEIFKEEEKTR